VATWWLVVPAGYLDTAAGALTNRGVNGNYWSSTQSSVTNGWNLNFNSGNSNMNSNTKAYGFTARCLRDYTHDLPIFPPAYVQAGG
jgi:uncharacterized protein (TIGR02145 family)